MNNKIVCIGLLGFAFSLSACIEETSDDVPTAGDESAPGAADEPRPPEGAADVQDVGVDNVYLGPTNTEVALGAHGGGGGSYTGHVTPPAIIYAVSTRSGAMSTPSRSPGTSRAARTTATRAAIRPASRRASAAGAAGTTAGGPARSVRA